MLLTEEEAKTKWCPMVRVGMYGANSTASQNRSCDGPLRSDESWECIGSKCAMWRWEGPASVVSGSHSADQKYRDRGFEEVGVSGNNRIFKVKNRTGYCGLAGTAHP